MAFGLFCLQNGPACRQAGFYITTYYCLLNQANKRKGVLKSHRSENWPWIGKIQTSLVEILCGENLYNEAFDKFGVL